jgi:hypothetical protein
MWLFDKVEGLMKLETSLGISLMATLGGFVSYHSIPVQLLRGTDTVYPALRI